jgi:ATP-binding cassette subfamily B protein
MTVSNQEPPVAPIGMPNLGAESGLWRSYQYLKPYWKITLSAYLTLVVMIGLNLAIPQLIRWMIDSGIHNGNLQLLGIGVLALLSLSLVKGLLTYFQGKWSEMASQSVAYDLRNELQRKLTLLSFSYHDKTETGELLSRAIQDVERIRFLTGRATLRILEALLLLIGTAGVLLWMNSSLALLILAAMPLLIYRALYFGRRYRPLALEIQRALAVLTTRVEQSLRGAMVVKAFAQEEAENRSFQEANEAWFDLSAFAARMQAINLPLLFLIANIGTVAILWYGGILVVRQQLTLGELVAFIAYLGQLIDPVRRLGMIIPAVAMAGSAAERVFDVLDSIPEVVDAPDAIDLPPVHGHVRFDHLSFSYGHRDVLRDIDFEAQPGQVIALLGATGSGKTSLVNLIPRFYDPTQGAVLMDGYNLRRLRLNSLRSQIGIVLQETVLFAGSVRENIAFGRPDCSEEELQAAAKAAQAHEFILHMREGYDTPVGERGVTLSGGQKQRLAIARALLLDPRILILDDATASVDAETERKIQIALENLMQGRTTFVIAHRLNTLRKADLILVLEKGRIVARGVHDSLLRESEIYRETYLRQVMSVDLDQAVPQIRSIFSGDGPAEGAA